MSIVVIDVQLMENLAARKWDGVGTCPQLWVEEDGLRYWTPLKDGEDPQVAKANLAARVSKSNDFVRYIPFGQAFIADASALDAPHDDHDPVYCSWCDETPHRATARSNWIEAK